MVRSRLELTLAGLGALGLLVYGIYMASKGMNGTLGVAVASGVTAIITGAGIHTLTRRMYRNGNQNGN